MIKKINNEIKELIDEAVKRLQGYERREYQAHITLEYLGISQKQFYPPNLSFCS